MATPISKQSGGETNFPTDLLNPDGTLNANNVKEAIRYIYTVFNELRPTADGPVGNRYVSVKNGDGFQYFIWVDAKGHLRYSNAPPTDPATGDTGGILVK